MSPIGSILLKSSWYRYLPLALAASIGIALSVVSFHVVRNWERTIVRADFESLVNIRAATWQREFDWDVESVRSIRTLQAVSGGITRQNFRTFIHDVVGSHQDLHVLGWIPRVEVSERPSIEAVARQEGVIDFQFRQWDTDGRIVGVAPRAEYFPVLLVEPLRRNEAILGLDLASSPHYRQILARARDTATAVITEPVNLVPVTDAGGDFVVFQPVYRTGTSPKTLEERRRQLTGYVFGVFHQGALTEEGLQRAQPVGMDIWLYDEMAPPGESLLYVRYSGTRSVPPGSATTGPAEPETWLRMRIPLKVPGHQWSLVFAAAPSFFAKHGESWAEWGVLAGGFLFTLLLTAYLFNTINRAVRNEQFTRELSRANEDLRGTREALTQARDGLEIKVRERTARLLRANAQLVDENEERLRMVEALKESRGRIKAVMENVSDGIITIDEAGTIESINPAAEEIFGYVASEIVGRNFTVLIPEQEDPQHNGYLRHFSNIDQAQILGAGAREILGKRKDGSAFPADLAVSEAWVGSRRLYIGTVRDITDRKRAEEKLVHSANYDQLTGLPNRNLFWERLKHATALAQRYLQLVAVFFIDLDGFKRINDTLGHSSGDNLLRLVAERLSGCIRESDTVARRGGDEFTILLESVAHVDDATWVAQKIVEAMERPFVLDGQEVFATASIGITIYPFDTENIDQLLVDADVAMYRAKELGKNRYQFYAVDMNKENAQRLKLETSLRRALDNGEFLLHYQPQIHLASGKVVGTEALIRWQNADRGLVPPAEFIPLLEETGLIVPVGEWVLRTACTQSRRWQEMGFPAQRVSVNLSARQFDEPELVEKIESILNETGLEARFLELEVTESAVMRDERATIAKLRELDAMGVSIAIDDFGTGHSSLAYLRRFPVDTLKIDRSFVKDVENQIDDQVIARTVIAMGKALNMRIIAEGVENAAQMEIFASLGCDMVQGYYFSRPLPAEEVAQIFGDAGIQEREFALDNGTVQLASVEK